MKLPFTKTAVARPELAFPSIEEQETAIDAPEHGAAQAFAASLASARRWAQI